jgi:hypothetical protein
MEPHDRLKHARISHGETLESAAQRSGVAERLLRVIEDGRFELLPPGIYGRSAIRAYATACGLDAVEILAACDPLLPAFDDPISAMGRLRGVRSPKPTDTSSSEPLVVADAPCPDWRLLAAALLDAGFLGVILTVVIASAMVMARAPAAALAGSAAAFGVVGVLLGGSYFVWLGGLAGTTVGQRAVGLVSCSQERGSANLRTIASRAMRAATEDLRFIRDLGLWVGRLTTHDKANQTSTDSSGNQRTVVAGS